MWIMHISNFLTRVKQKKVFLYFLCDDVILEHMFFCKVCLSHYSLQFEPNYNSLGQNWHFSYKESRPRRGDNVYDPVKMGGGAGKFEPHHFLIVWSLLKPKLQKNQFWHKNPTRIHSLPHYFLKLEKLVNPQKKHTFC